MLPERDGDGFGAVGDVELAVELQQVELDGGLGQVVLPGDVIVCEAAASFLQMRNWQTVLSVTQPNCSKQR